MKTTFASVRLWLVASLVLGFATLLHAATDFTVVSTSIVSETRVGRTTFDYQMRATVRNNGAAIDAFAMRVSSGIATTSAVVNAVNFGPIGAGATATSLDTFTIRHDRTVPFDADVLSWVELPAPPQPTVTPITGPVGTNSSTINGTTAPGATVEITGGTAVVTTTAHATTGAFSADVGLQTNRINRIYAVAIDGASRRSPPAAIEILHDLQTPNLFIDFPTDGAELTNETIVVAGRVGDLLSGFMGLDVTVNGQAANVIVGIGQNGTFERGAVALVEGANTITAVATDANGNTTTRSITVTRVPLEGPQMHAVSGDGQTGTVNERLTAPIILLVTEADGTTPIANKIVTFTVTRSDGRLFASSVATTTPGVTQLQVVTDAGGLARAYWQMGTDAGCGNNRVSVTSRDIAGTINFCASANPAPPSQINIGAGNNQRGEAGAPLPLALRAWVNDSCNGAAGIPVLFTVVSGGGKVNGGDAVVIDTSLTGHAEVTFTLGPAQGNNVVQATFAGNPGAPATFVAYGLVRVENASTSFSGLVLNNASQPVGGAACTLQIAGQTSRNTTSDVNGRFTFADCPAGTGYVHVNGLPATTAGGVTVPTGSFPALSFSVVVVPNVANSLPTPVLLPTLDPANAKIYNGTRDVVLTCQGIAGLKMTIKAGSMTRFDGTKPSASSPEIVTLNQVHHDDVPMPMPDGAAPPFAWTLQPAGATFDPAITIEYPNMSGLPAGAVAYFLSFNHATEKFEIVASGHVTDDGSTIVTDPGVGLTISGWGCNCPPYSVATDCEGCEFKCKDPGQIDGGTVEIEKEVVCEGQTLKWTASGAMHVGAEVEIKCEDGTTTSPYVGVIKYKWEISGGALPGPMQGEGATAELPNAMAGEYTCTFTVEVEDAPGAQVSCVPGSKQLDPTIGAAVKVEFSRAATEDAAGNAFGYDDMDTADVEDDHVSVKNGADTFIKVKITGTTTKFDKVFFTSSNEAIAQVSPAQGTAAEFLLKITGGSNKGESTIEARADAADGEVCTKILANSYKEIVLSGKIVRVFKTGDEAGTIAPVVSGPNVSARANRLLKYPVGSLTITSTDKKGVDFDKNGNGKVDYYNDGTNPETKAIYDSLAADGIGFTDSVVLKESFPDVWRIAGAVAAGDTTITLTGGAGGLDTTESFSLGHPTAGGAETFRIVSVAGQVVTIDTDSATAGNQGFASAHPHTGDDATQHAVVSQGHTVVGLSSNEATSRPALIVGSTDTDIGEISAHEHFHGKGLSDVNYAGNVMHYTTVAIDDSEPYRFLELVAVVTGTPNPKAGNPKESQWDDLPR